eukprot:scaffold55781_cov36-Phaeocystis_antarctica.AAC.1
MGAASSSTRGSGGAPTGPASSWERRAVQSRQARPEEAQEPSWGAAQEALWPCWGAAVAVHAAEGDHAERRAGLQG